MERLTKKFHCCICQHICVDAVESLCCDNLFCQKCVLPIKICPCCSEEFKTEPSRVGRKIIPSLPIKCNHCGVLVERGSIERHLLECKELEHMCSSLNATKSQFITELFLNDDRNQEGKLFKAFCIFHTY